MNNVVALSYLMKMGGTQNKLPVQVSKEIWEYLLDKAITITAEYLPRALNKEADMPSRTVKDSSEWKLNPVVLVDPRYRPFCFQSFPSSSSLCLLDTGSMQQMQGCFSNVCDSKKRICSSPIFSNRQNLTQSFDRSRNVNFDNTSMANPVLVP